MANKKQPMKKRDGAASAAARALGSLGGRASARALTPEQRTAKARKAGLARQAKARTARKRGGAM
jgi:hypothetical protein